MADLFPYWGTFELPTLPPSVFARQSSDLMSCAPSVWLTSTDLILVILADHYVGSLAGDG